MRCSDPASPMRTHERAAILVGISPQDAIHPRRRCCRHSVRIMWEVPSGLADVSSLGDFPGATTLKESTASSPTSSLQAVPDDTIDAPQSGHCLSSSLGSIIWVQKPPHGRPGVYHIRKDRLGSFHTYPDLGGPFQSLNEAEDVISSHINKLYPPVKFEERAGESYVDMIIRKALYWPDGTRKKCSKAEAFQNVNNNMNQLAKVILDMYNNDHNLLEDLAFELKGVINYEPIIESRRWFDHINFTATTKGLNGLDSNCYTCKIGNKSMKHPSDVNSYVGGHCYIKGIYDTIVSSDSEEDEDAEEQRLRKMYQARVYSDSRGYFASGRDVHVGPFPTSDELYAALYHHYHLRLKPCDPAPPPPPQLPTQCEGLLRGASEPESAQALQEPDVFSVGELLGAIALKEPIISSPSSSPQAVPEDNIDAVPSGCCLSSSPGSVIWVHKPPEGRRGSYHIRMDRSGLFHTFEERDGESIVDMMEEVLQTQVTQDVHNDMRQLARVILDMYNDDHSLSGGLAYELKDVIHFQPIMENCTWFDHLNFTALTKGDNELDYQIHLFFAELMCLVGQKDYIVTCCCALKSDDNGNCYYCKLQNVNLKHPNDTNQYAGGHEYLCGIYDTEEMSESEDEEKEEQRIRKLYEALAAATESAYKRQGACAEPQENFEQTLSMSGYDLYQGDDINLSLAYKYIYKERKVMVATFKINEDYTRMRAGEIYSYDSAQPKKTDDGLTWSHCVLVIGFGVREGRKYLVFQDSHGLEQASHPLLSHWAISSKPHDHEALVAAAAPRIVFLPAAEAPTPHHRRRQGSNPHPWRPVIYHIRMDHGGSFHTYPALDGPFLNLSEAEDAINRHLDSLKRPIFKEQDGVSEVERIIHKSLYWPDGNRKKYSRSQTSQNVDERRRQMVQVLLDKYNDDHDLFEDLAYVLQDVVHYQLIVEGIKWFNHFNFTAKTSGADIDNLFFTEVMSSQGEEDWVVTCCCLIKSADNGICYGCKNDRNLDMKHPDNNDTYMGGHEDIVMPFEIEDFTESDDDDEGLDDSDEPEDIFYPVFKP
uniref:DUF3615 domain-containing protein n=1 Tax=Oryza barthii TaxID=65489 RepID=A0A0D3GCF9_9ORYZ